MKANKTNRSSNLDPINKRENTSLRNTATNNHEQLRMSSSSNIGNSMQSNSRKFSSSLESNSSFDGSVASRQIQQQNFYNPQISQQEQMNFNGFSPTHFHNQLPQFSQNYSPQIPDPSFQ